jgi:hypothetical protein
VTLLFVLPPEEASKAKGVLLSVRPANERLNVGTFNVPTANTIGLLPPCNVGTSERLNVGTFNVPAGRRKQRKPTTEHGALNVRTFNVLAPSAKRGVGAQPCWVFLSFQGVIPKKEIWTEQ